MGYVHDTIYKLNFEDGAYEGLEVRMRSLNVRDFFVVDELRTRMGRSTPGETNQNLVDLYTHLAGAMVSWNVEEVIDGVQVAVPATPDGVMSQDFDLVQVITKAWIDAISGVPAPLASASTSGRPLVEASLPMETLSVSQAS